MKLKLIIVLTVFGLLAGNVLAQEANAGAKPAGAHPAPSATLPTAKEIFDRYARALGGRDANAKIRTRVMKGTVEMSPMNIRGIYETYSAAPNKSYSKITLQGIGDLLEGFDGTTAWVINPIQGSRIKEGEELLQTRHLNNFHRETGLEKAFAKLEVKGIEKIGDREAYVVVGTPAGLAPETMYFDTQSGLLLRTDLTLVSPEGRIPARVFYQDMREVDGIRLPHLIRTVLPQFEMVMTVTEVRHDVAVDAARFARPK